MYSGVSGLKANMTEMDAISNNIANINTTGYKSSSVNFEEMFTETLKAAGSPQAGGTGGTDPEQVGLGVSVASVSVDQTSGSEEQTGVSTDVDIQGSGYLMETDGSSKFYTRDGTLKCDSDGNLVSASSGMKVLGWMADPTTGAIDNTAVVSSASTISLPLGQLAVAKQTSNVTYGGNLDSTTTAGAATTASVQVYDSLGNAHSVDLTLTKSATSGEWNWSASSPDGTVTIGDGSSSTGTLDFDGNGKVTGGTGTGTISLALTSADGATSPLTCTLDMSSITQLSGTTSVTASSQDGTAIGTLQSFTIGTDGVISGTFSNGMIQPLAQIAMSTFSNPSGLTNTGSNTYQQSSNSGLPQIGTCATGGRGTLLSGYLEGSNVDLPTEFANMIVAQRGFQANSKIITTSDQILQDLVNLKQS
jgi:flagellar hook protein FlgE